MSRSLSLSSFVTDVDALLLLSKQNNYLRIQRCVTSPVLPSSRPDTFIRPFLAVQSLLFLPAIYTELTYSFSSGSMHYLSKLEHYGAITVAYTGQTLTIDANIAFDSVLLTYDYFVKVLLLEQRGKIFADASSIWANVKLNFDILTCRVTLKTIELTDIKSITIWIQGSTLTEQLITPFCNIGAFVIKNALIKLIEEQVSASLRTHFDRINATICPWNPVPI
ncbi:uncharacterized protein LOC100876738 isoform X2 [Megachile rotundata]|uniref:uncharacterized protein LOC100876738 isoform X2 n=1 Tax=Megachile rotundata TaxID=143995 RepID=UPI003FD3FA70